MRRRNMVLAAGIFLFLLVLPTAWLLRSEVAWAFKKVVNSAATRYSPQYDLEALLADRGPFPRGPFLQSPTIESIIVSWTLEKPGSCSLRYGADGMDLDKEILSAESVTHAVKVEGLDEGTDYNYSVACDAEQESLITDVKEFSTAKETGEISFVVMGDSGGGTQAQLALAEVIETIKPDFILHTGDAVQIHDIPWDMDLYDALFFLPYQNLIDEVPIYLAMGNHDFAEDRGATYLDLFHLPESEQGGERYYTFEYGETRFFALDTNDDLSPGSAQYVWLDEALASSDSTWEILFMHYPPLSGGVHGDTPGLAEAIFPLIQRHGVEVVFSGHDHHYERIVSDETPDTLFIVNGGGGYSTRRVVPGERTQFAAKRFHIVEVEIDEDTLELTAHGTDGEIFDTFTITK